MTHRHNLLHVDDVGVRIAVLFRRNLASSDFAALMLTKPDGTVIERSLDFTPGFSRGFYTTISGDIDQAGIWKYQGRVDGAGGLKFHGQGGTIRVLAHYEDVD